MLHTLQARVSLLPQETYLSQTGCVASARRINVNGQITGRC